MKRIIITGLAVIFLVVAAMPALVVAQQAPSRGSSDPTAQGAVPKKCVHKKKGKKKKRQNATHAAKCTYRNT